MLRCIDMQHVIGWEMGEVLEFKACFYGVWGYKLQIETTTEVDQLYYWEHGSQSW